MTGKMTTHLLQNTYDGTATETHTTIANRVGRQINNPNTKYEAKQIMSTKVRVDLANCTTNITICHISVT